MELIDKDVVVAEIEKIEYETNYEPFTDEVLGKRNVCRKMRDFLETIEEKEVDLDFHRFAEEMETVFALPPSKTKNTEEEPLNWEYAIAKHFYSLGFKAQKV